MKDFMDVLKAANKLEKVYKKENYKADIRIAILGSISIQHFVRILRYQLYSNGIMAEIYEGEYNGIAMDVFQRDSPLYEFQPDIVILLPHYMDLKEYPFMLESNKEVEKLVSNVVLYYKSIWEKLSGISECTILQSNYVVPCERILGNLENKVHYSKSSFIRRINSSLEYEKSENVIIIDSEALACNIGKQSWFDYSAYFISKAGCRLDYLPDYCNLFMSIILNLKGKVRKCLVLDLDNTLWGGVVGDVGYNGIEVDPNNAVGESYLYFQKYLKELKQRGVILAVCSKNDEWIAKEPFEKNDKMILKLDDFACFIADWNDKATNIRRIATILNISVDSIVFFDDNPAEREIVRSFLPDVHVVDVPKDAADYVRTLDYEQPFNWLNLTKEDLLRTDSYIQNANRVKLQESFVDYKEYLKALEMKGITGVLKENDIERFTQLVNKSNQFNLRTQRYTDSEIFSFLRNPTVRCIFVKLKDKFSDYGLISSIILKKDDNKVFIDTWVMSCRVLKRGVENLAFKEILKQCSLMGGNEIIGEYIKSSKNSIVEGFYDSLGFELIEDTGDTKTYKYIPDIDHMQNQYFIERIGI